MNIVMALTILAIGILASVTPVVSRATVPLGVSVPRAHIHEPVVHRAVRRFEGSALVVSVTLAAVALFVGDVGSFVTFLAQMLLIAACYTVCRRSIIAAKQAEGWYDDVPVRLNAQLTGANPIRVSLLPYLVTVAATLGVMVYGATQYSHMPDRVITHAGFDGTPDAWGHKSVLNVFGVPLIALALAGLMYAGAYWTARASSQVKPDGDAAAASNLARLKAEYSVRVLGQIMLIISCGLLAFAIMTWHEVHGVVFACVMAALLVGPLVPLAHMMLVLLRAGSGGDVNAHMTPSSSRAVAPGANADSPDDDRFWKAGMFYCNPDDPNTWVPKRFGVGTTVNFGSPGGKAFGVIIVAVLVLSVALPVIASLL